MYQHTPNLKHIIANKCSMKALYRFIQIEMKEHDHGVIFLQSMSLHVLIFFFHKDASGMDI